MDHNGILIDLTDISFGYPTNPRLLAGLKFILKQGDRIGVIGPNGCGKTTLLHIIMGLTVPQQGRISVLGQSGRGSELETILCALGKVRLSGVCGDCQKIAQGSG